MWCSHEGDTGSSTVSHARDASGRDLQQGDILDVQVERKGVLHGDVHLCLLVRN